MASVTKFTLKENFAIDRKPLGSSMLLSKAMVIRFATAVLHQGKLKSPGVEKIIMQRESHISKNTNDMSTVQIVGKKEKN
ncbi:MAG: hypothetical protein WCK35_28605 [Chloroflexota bacterium]